jgi:hypothetical protein
VRCAPHRRPTRFGALAALAALFGCSSPPSSIVDETPPGPPDGAPPDGQVACNPLAPACPEGAGCFWAEPGRFECSASVGLPRYHVCLVSSQCSPGDGCHLDDFYDFYCTGYCDHTMYGGMRDPDRCADKDLCGDFDGAIGRCLGICDPLAPDCPDGLGCYAILDGSADLCLPITGNGKPGDLCQRNNDCEPGAGCIGSGSAARCAAYCDHDENPDGDDPRCEEGEVCGSLGAGERIGVCAES